MADIIFFNSNPGGGGGSGVLTLDNGLIKTGTNGQLGGNLIKGTTLNINGFQFDVVSPDSFIRMLNDGDIILSFTNAISGLTAFVAANDIQAAIGVNDGTNVSQIVINASMLVEDAINSKGLENAGDYEANFTARSLVTRQFLENTGVRTLDNGLTKTGTNGQLGGALTKNTVVDTTGFVLTLNSNTDANAALQITKSNTGSVAMQVEGTAQFDNNVHIDEILSIENGSGNGAVNFSAGNYIQFIDVQNLRLHSLEYLVSGTFAFDFHQRAFNEHVYIYGKRIRNSDNEEFITTAGGVTITGQTQLTVAPVNPNDLVRLQDLSGGSSGIVSALAVQGQSASATLVTYHIPVSSGNGVFNINYFIIVRTVTGGFVTLSVAYTDSTGVGRTFTTVALSGLGPGNFSPLTISCTNNTDIVISYSVTGIILFDVGEAIQLLF